MPTLRIGESVPWLFQNARIQLSAVRKSRSAFGVVSRAPAHSGVTFSALGIRARRKAYDVGGGLAVPESLASPTRAAARWVAPKGKPTRLPTLFRVRLKSGCRWPQPRLQDTWRIAHCTVHTSFCADSRRSIYWRTCSSAEACADRSVARAYFPAKCSVIPSGHSSEHRATQLPSSF